ncbi:phosphodiesterase [Paenarthrobacter sp. DKR-5]|uniref:phosphodiesterase n=1 Tax=Paenarthrobacter sp. DKR-5 TaxID=2835535 RepID=UPI001BDBBD33|nr:phosphodiesterase [Paenarthrobacter sp. DKR-5]MBT1002301.1 phosphodiesterase [Paenarthrobacter sp. DKR-5]
MNYIPAEYPRPRHFILHLSDTHLVGGPEPLYGAVDSEGNLRRLFDELLESGNKPEAIVFTGDLADRGEAEAYKRLTGIVQPAAEAMGTELIWAMGNHDDRANFRSLLLGEEAGTEPVDRSYDINGLRIITLDSTVPGYHHGEISPAQLQWLADELKDPAPDGTILAMHHPPVPSVLDLAVLVELRDQQPLADVLWGSDVRTIIAGHLHYTTTATFAGIPVSVASATCYTQDLNIPAGHTRPQDGAQSFNMVHVYDHTVVSSVVPLGNFPTVGEHVGAQETRRRIAEAGIRVPSLPDRAPGRAEPGLNQLTSK